jgi:hypothetical protein
MDTLAYVKFQDYIASRVFVSADSEKREMRDSSVGTQKHSRAWQKILGIADQ